MTRTIVFLLLTYAFLHAASTVELKKGWQLIGVQSTLDVSAAFNNDNVEIVWGFDAASQSWAGYSPDGETHVEILEQYAALGSLEPWQGVWVFSNSDWTLEAQQNDPPETAGHNTITLVKGWNLVAIPQQSVVSDTIFGDAVVWKYGADQAWSVNKGTLDFPSIDAIRSGEGLWVKSERDRSIELDSALSKLQTFDSEASMLAYIRKMSYYHGGHYAYIDAQPVTTDLIAVDAEAESAEDATTTNLQEEGVDEGDILKHDGTYIFNADNTSGKIIVTSFESIAREDYMPLNAIDINGSVVVMYLQNNRLSVVSNQQHYGIADTSVAAETASRRMARTTYIIPDYLQQSFQLEVFDVSDVHNISRLASHKVDGYYSDSRLIDGRLFLISTFDPYIQYEYPMDYENPEILAEQLLPVITSDGNSSALVTPSRLYAPMKLDQRTRITSISSFTHENGRYNETVSFLGNSHKYYASKKSLYLVSNGYPLFFNWTHYKEQQVIYKFSLGEAIAYEGRGSVEGRLLDQFSMSEHEGYLRVATTSGWAWWGDGMTTNTVYTLKGIDNSLLVQGILSGLGHEGETIRAVRFAGERGYVVTFRQTDPFYTLDLSDPKHPKTVGELSIPGFSEYLHIVDENRILSIGRDADESGVAGALQFQLFDVTDFASPQLVDKIQIGDRNTYSEAEHNHKAFAYRGSDQMFGVPYRVYDGVERKSSEHFGVYQLDGMSINALHTVTSESSDWGNVGRGLIFDMNGSSYGALLKGSNIICETVK